MERHCEQSEAIQTAAALDCFVAALLAMTKQKHQAFPTTLSGRSSPNTR
jgi:hypothetical protein